MVVKQGRQKLLRTLCLLVASYADLQRRLKDRVEQAVVFQLLVDKESQDKSEDVCEHFQALVVFQLPGLEDLSPEHLCQRLTHGLRMHQLKQISLLFQADNLIVQEFLNLSAYQICIFLVAFFSRKNLKIIIVDVDRKHSGIFFDQVAVLGLLYRLYVIVALNAAWLVIRRTHVVVRYADLALEESFFLLICLGNSQVYLSAGILGVSDLLIIIVTLKDFLDQACVFTAIVLDEDLDVSLTLHDICRFGYIIGPISHLFSE